MKTIKILLPIVILLGLIIGCTESPLKSIDSPIIGSWGGTSTVFYPGPGDRPMAALANIFITFYENGDFEFYQYNNGLGTPPSLEFNGSFSIKGDSVRLNLTNDVLYPSPLELDGTFWFEVTDNALNMQQIVGGDSPKTHNIHFIPWASFETILPILGYWEGMSKVTYPGAADEPISDSLEVMFFFQMDGSYSFGSLGDSLSDPIIFEGSYYIDSDTVRFLFSGETYVRTPLNLRGEFVFTASGDSLEFLQKPPGEWVDAYHVRLLKPLNRYYAPDVIE